jgi:hypothetical protein
VTLMKTAKKSENRKSSTGDKDRKALRLAETTDLSPKQAKDLMDKHGKDSAKIEKEARNFKAEG